MMGVKITRDHLRDGRQGDIHFCALALALRDMGYSDATVGTTAWQPSATTRRLYLGIDALGFRHRFDTSHLRFWPFLRPITVEVEVP